MSQRTEKDLRKSTEVAEKATRRRFTAVYKRQILAEADQCTEPGELGKLLRREGLYSSSLKRWRQEREAGSLEPKHRGRKPNPNKKEAQQLARLQRDNKRLTERLRQAELIIDVQKKVSEMMGIVLPNENND